MATPIEQEINGVENMLYMSSRSTNDGQMTLDVTFKLGVNLDMAQVLVQNRVAVAEAKLPEEVKRQGVTTKKKSPSILLCVNLISEKEPDRAGAKKALEVLAASTLGLAGSLPGQGPLLAATAVFPGRTETEHYKFDQLYLSNYATTQLKDPLSRLEGVGDVQFLGPRDYSMRIWLDPRKLASRHMTAGDVTTAIREQNRAGRGRPARPAAHAQGPGFPAPAQHPGPAQLRTAVPRHHRQDG